MASSPSLLGAAVRHGIVPVQDVRSGRVRVRAVSRSNAVHVIERDGVAVGYVKQAGAAARLDGDDTVGVEAALLGAIAPLELAPTPVRQGGPGSVWMSALPGEELSRVTDPSVRLAAAVDLGRVLARLHRHRVPHVGVPTAPRPWPLLDRLPPSMEGGADRSEVAPILDRLADPTVRRALGVARTQWGAGHLIHGDVSSGNVIVRTLPTGDIAVGLVDFELGGKGCPEHDLASAAAMLTELSTPDADLAARCLKAYWDAGGPAGLTAPWRCVRALLTSWQVALTHGEAGAADVARLLARAEAAAAEVTS